MPIYEYVCDLCHHKFEIRLGVKEVVGHVKCPKCSHVAEKKPSVFTFSVKI